MINTRLAICPRLVSRKLCEASACHVNLGLGESRPVGRDDSTKTRPFDYSKVNIFTTLSMATDDKAEALCSVSSLLVGVLARFTARPLRALPIVPLLSARVVLAHISEHDGNKLNSSPGSDLDNFNRPVIYEAAYRVPLFKQ